MVYNTRVTAFLLKFPINQEHGDPRLFKKPNTLRKQKTCTKLKSYKLMSTLRAHVGIIGCIEVSQYWDQFMHKSILIGLLGEDRLFWKPHCEAKYDLISLTSKTNYRR